MRLTQNHLGAALFLHNRLNTSLVAEPTNLADTNDSAVEDTSVQSLPTSPVTTISPIAVSAVTSAPTTSFPATCVDEQHFAALNGKCSTFEEYLRLPAGFHIRFELVEGRLIWRPRMSDYVHDRIISFIINRLTEYYARTEDDVEPAITPSLYVPAARRAFINELGISLPSEAPTDSPSSHESVGEEVRIPDIAVGRVHQIGQETSSAADLATLTYNKGDPPPHMVVEVTSKSTRKVDLNQKFRSYARAGVEEYIIIDRQKTFDFSGNSVSDIATPCVIVCSRENNGGLRCSTGDPEIVRQKPPTRAGTTESFAAGTPGSAEHTVSTGNSNISSPDEPKGMFYRKVFRGTQTVECSYLSYFNLTAEDILTKASAHETRRREVQQDKLHVQQLEQKAEEASREAEFWKRKAKALGRANESAERDVAKEGGEKTDEAIRSAVVKRRKTQQGES